MKYQKLFKTLNRSRLQGMYWCAHKTATLTSIQHTVGRLAKMGCPIFLGLDLTKNLKLYSSLAEWKIE